MCKFTLRKCNIFKDVITYEYKINYLILFVIFVAIFITSIRLVEYYYFADRKVNKKQSGKQSEIKCKGNAFNIVTNAILITNYDNKLYETLGNSSNDTFIISKTK